MLGHHPEATRHIGARMWCQMSKGSHTFYERVRVTKLAHEYMIRLTLWNIGSLTGRLTELVDAMVRRNVSILCVQETKWVGEKVKL